jgi:hypothetical protein
MATCLCDPCGREFSGLTAFDKHQQVDYSRRPAVVCLDPATVGLVLNGRGRWGSPSDGSWAERFRAADPADLAPGSTP